MEKTMTQKFYAGCDIGSTTGKAVILGDNGIVASAIVPREIDPEETALLALGEAFKSVPELTSYKDLAYLVGTGYGRSEIPFAGENISEISCHAMGASYCDLSIKTIVDIGGQDVKGISINGDGTVKEFAMNDKCAAGTGRFFEAMARIFRMELGEFSDLSLKSKKTIAVTAQCSVFAETEVISLLAKKNPPADIAAGIQSAVAKRCFTLLKRVGINPKVTITGGCAKNRGLVKELEKVLKVDIAPLSVDPQIIGALGAAVYARKKHTGM
jgi:predicted CoA-substrate-specific enzyme activase